MLKFKQNELAEQFEKLDKRLQAIVYALTGYIQYNFGKDLIVTSVFRDQEGSVHKYLRGLDFRVQPSYSSSIYTDDEIAKIESFCNHFDYGTKADIKTLKVHGPVIHGHLQVNNTGKTYLLSKNE